MRTRRGRAGGRGSAIRSLVEGLERRVLLTAGDLDPSFGAGGIVASDYLAPNPEIAHEVAVDPVSGKIYVVGVAMGVNQGQNFAVARYNADGSLDTSFGNGGWAFAHFDLSDEAHGVAVQADGRIVVAGGTRGGGVSDAEFALARFNTDGTLDNSFGAGGKVVTDFFGGTDWVQAVAIQADGRIVAAGPAVGPGDESGNFAVARYNLDGSLDPTFGGGGWTTTDVKRVNPFTGRWEPTNDLARDLALQSDGRIVVAGHSTGAGFTVARYTANGNLDAGFGAGGIVRDQLHTNGEYAEAVALLPDGRVVVAGYAAVPDANGMAKGTDFAVARYLPGGARDLSFGNGVGRVFTDLGNLSDDVAWDLVVQPDGKVIAGGRSVQDYASAADRGPAMVRYNLDGGRDPTFGVDGKVVTDAGPFSGSNDGIALQADGRIVGAGTTERVGRGLDFFVARYVGDPAPVNHRPVVDAGPDQSGVEGQTFLIQGSVSDADSDPLTVRWTLSRNGFPQRSGPGARPEFVALNDGLYEFSVTADDGRGGVTSDTTVIEVANVPPSFEVADVVLDPDSGGRLLVSVPFTDPGVEREWVATLFSGVGGSEGIRAAAVDAVNRTITVDFTYPASGTYQATLAVWDDGSTPATREFTVTVDLNHAPAVDAGEEQSGVEGGLFLLTPAASDADGDSLSYHWDVTRDGVAVAIKQGSKAGQLNLFAPENGRYLATVTVEDGRGGIATDTVVITVANVGPTMPTQMGETLGPDSGGHFARTIPFTDPGADTWTALVQYGVGDVLHPAELDPVNKTIHLAHDYAGSGVFAVNVFLSDDDGGVYSQGFFVTVNLDLPPTAVIQASPIVEGQTLFLDASGSADPEGGPLTYEWDVLGDGQFRAASQLSVLQLDWSVLQGQGMGEGPATYHAFRVRVTDSAGNAAVSGLATVSVANAPPVVSVVTVAPGEPTLPGTIVTATASFTDAGALDQHTAAWDWGDGAVTLPVATAAGVVSMSHEYSAPGTYVVTLTVSDDDGGVARSRATIVVLTPEQAVQAVAEEVQRIVASSGSLTEGQASGLVSKLDRAATSAARANDATAVALLGAFKSQVLGFAQAGRLSQAEADALIEEADGIIEWIQSH